MLKIDGLSASLKKAAKFRNEPLKQLLKKNYYLRKTRHFYTVSFNFPINFLLLRKNSPMIFLKQISKSNGKIQTFQART